MFIEDFDNFLKLQNEIENNSFWDYYNEQKRLLGADKLKETPIGKKVSFYFKWKSKIERSAKNGPSQGTAADMTKLAEIWIHREFKKRKLNAWIVLSVHDEIICECAKEIAKEVGEIMQDCMERAGKMFCKIVPMVAIPDISDYWRKG